MKRAVVILAVGLALAGCGKEASERPSAAPKPAPPPAASKPAKLPAKAPRNSILAFTWESPDATGELVEVDPLSLERVSRRSIELDIGGPGAFSPDGSILVRAVHDVPALQFVDLRSMRVVGKPLVLKGKGSVTSLVWAAPRSLVAVVEDWTARRSRVVAVDAVARRAIAEHPLDGVVVGLERNRDTVVMLVSAFDSIGPSRLAVVSARGDVRFVRLDEISSGFEQVETEDDEPVSRQVIPGLAVDRLGRRAVVVPPGRRVAEIDLDSLAVSYHDLSQPVSLLERFRNWLEPAAAAKSIEGPSRYAVWLGRDLVAVAGFVYRTKKGRNVDEVPTGLELIDTRNWSVRSLDRDVSMISPAGDLLLAYGGTDGMWHGLTAYGPDGTRRFHVLGRRPVTYVEVIGRYAYVVENEWTTFIVDLRRGRFLGKVTTDYPTALVGASAR